MPSLYKVQNMRANWRSSVR